MIRVVVVEDEYYERKGLIHTFDWKALDCKIVGEAANGRDGIAVVEEQKPDLVIADIEMPVINGIEMAKRLRSKQVRAEFVFLTAHQKFSYVHSALKLEAVDYLLKPFRYEDLTECIRRIKIRLHKVDEETSKTMLLTEVEIQAKSPYVKKAMAYVHDRYTTEVTVTEVAGLLNISEAYFCRLFKKETGYTFGHYLTHYRIHVAAGLLSAFPMKVGEAAEQAGFSDANYFSSIFKRIMNLSPTEYQDQNKTW